MSKKLVGLSLIIPFLMCMPLSLLADSDFLFEKGDIYGTPMAGGIFYLNESQVDLDISFIVGARAGYFLTDKISLEADFDYSWTRFGSASPLAPPPFPFKDMNANNYYALANVLYHFNPIADNLAPYVIAGIGWTGMRTSRFNEDGFAGNVGAGLHYGLNKYLLLRGELRYLGATNPRQDDIIASLGLAFNVPYREEAAPPPPPPPVWRDSDEDGVPDNLDKCPTTPKGCIVDKDGCPLDADGDGVCDGIDQCPNTPKGCTVDARGCPLDSDGDGVCDGIDQCPDTPKGALRLDEKGCSPISAVGIRFEFDKATILPRSYPELNQFVKLLKDNPTIRVEIQGHTDSKGAADYNQKLSERRAEAVRNYFVSKGIPASQMITKGYGMTKPIADNATEEGRAMNRRIEYWRVYQ